MSDVLTTISTRATPQAEQADKRQVVNSAGGYVFELDDVARLRRFLVLGSDGGTYYVNAKDLTRDNAGALFRLIDVDPVLVVNTIVDVSAAGRAPRQNPAMFALAAVAGCASDEGRRFALAALPKVARTGTHLFLFARYVEQFRGWGPTLRRAVADWYTEKPVDDVAYQAVKYRQREGWSHRDLLRLSHPVTADPARRGLFDEICGRETEHPHPLFDAWREVQTASSARIVQLIDEHPLSWEMLPDTALVDANVWRALIDKGMPQTALMRQLPRLTRLGVLTGGGYGRTVAEQLTDPERLRKARVHPVNVLVAARTYASGYSARGESTWAPERRIVDALDAAFYAAFGAVEPTGKRLSLALDVSGSMGTAISGLPLTAREATAALALVTAATEDDYEIHGFSRGFVPLSISPRQRLDDALRVVSGLPFDSTDCSVPMLHALQTGAQVDTFVVYTDNETWAGQMHPYQALRLYRERTGIDARLVVVGMTSTGFSIADPSDPGMLDVAGFDAAVPTLVSDFARGL